MYQPDEIKERLLNSGVGVFDSENRWAAFDRTISGTFEPIEMAVIECTISEEEVLELVAERIGARRQRNFERADQIRAQLADRLICVHLLYL